MPREDKNKTIAIVTYPSVALLDLVVTQTVLDRGTSYRTVSVGERTEPMDSNTPMVVIPERRFEEVSDPFPGTDPCLLPDAPSYEGLSLTTGVPGSSASSRPPGARRCDSAPSSSRGCSSPPAGPPSRPFG